MVDVVAAVAGGPAVRPCFGDGLEGTLVLEAAPRSAARGEHVTVDAR